MAAPIGNRFWEKRSSHGRNPIFSSPQDMWNAAIEYFEWVESNPLKEEKVWQFQGEIIRDEVSKIRAMTLEGLLLFLDISKQTWYDYCDKEDFIDVTGQIMSVMYSQKFSGAAADLLNANIIARDLGLSDKRETDNMHSFDFSNLSDEELKAIAGS